MGIEREEGEGVWVAFCACDSGPSGWMVVLNPVGVEDGLSLGWM